MADYRQQTGGVLDSSQVCAVCYDALTLCYSTTSQDLCCGSPTSVTVYVNAGETLATATNLYSDTALTTVATAGYYSDDPDIDCSTGPSGGILVKINADSNNTPIAYNNDADACGAIEASGLFIVYTGADQPEPEIGMVLYTDEEVTNPWDGGDLIYKITSFNANPVNYAADVDTQGILGNQTDICS